MFEYLVVRGQRIFSTCDVVTGTNGVRILELLLDGDINPRGITLTWSGKNIFYLTSPSPRLTQSKVKSKMISPFLELSLKSVTKIKKNKEVGIITLLQLVFVKKYFHVRESRVAVSH